MQHTSAGKYYWLPETLINTNACLHRDSVFSRGLTASLSDVRAACWRCGSSADRKKTVYCTPAINKFHVSPICRIKHTSHNASGHVSQIKQDFKQSRGNAIHLDGFTSTHHKPTSSPCHKLPAGAETSYFIFTHEFYISVASVESDGSHPQTNHSHQSKVGALEPKRYWANIECWLKWLNTDLFNYWLYSVGSLIQPFHNTVSSAFPAKNSQWEKVQLYWAEISHKVIISASLTINPIKCFTSSSAWCNSKPLNHDITFLWCSLLSTCVKNKPKTCFSRQVCRACGRRRLWSGEETQTHKRSCAL